MLSKKNRLHTLGPHPTPGDHNLNRHQVESTLPDDDPHQFQSFYPNGCGKGFFPLCNPPPPSLRPIYFWGLWFKQTRIYTRRILLHEFPLFWKNNFKMKILKYFRYLFLLSKPSLWSILPFWNHDLSKLESTITENASTQGSAFLAKKAALGRRFF